MTPRSLTGRGCRSEPSEEELGKLSALEYDHTLSHTEGMDTTERVTVTLPKELVLGIDQFERNRSRFVAEAVEKELARRRREALLESLRSPHPETLPLSEAGFAVWGESMAPEDEGLVDATLGRSVRWVEGQGWLEPG